MITANHGADSHTFLFASNPEGEAIKRDGNRIGVDFSKIDSVMFSHGHWGHVRKMVSTIRLINEVKNKNACAHQ